MELSKETHDKLVWLFLLAPGFITVAVIGMIVDLGQLSEFQITYYSFVLTVVDIVIAIAGLWLLEWFARKLKRQLHWSANTLLWTSLAVAVGTGLLFGLGAERDTFFVTLRSLPITKELNKRSSSRPSTFLLSQNTRGQLVTEGDARPQSHKVTDAFVLVSLKAGNQRYEGWPEFYGLGKDASEIYLSPACERVSEGGVDKVLKVPGPGVVIYEGQISSITFINRACSPCYLKWYPQQVTKQMQVECER